MKHTLKQILSNECTSIARSAHTRKQTLRKTIFTAIAIISLTIASVGWAAPITLNFNGFTNVSQNGKITKNSQPSPFFNKRTAAGQFDFNVVSSSDSVKWNTSLHAFCIDVDNWLVTNTNVIYSIVPATNVPGGLTPLQLARVGWLYDNHASSLGSSQFDAAFQLALWEIFFEQNTTLALDTGTFSSNNFGKVAGTTTRTVANNLLNGIGNGSVSVNWEFYVLNPLNPTNNQRLITALRVPPPAEINEPGTLALLLTGFGLTYLNFRRRSGYQTD